MLLVTRSLQCSSSDYTQWWSCCRKGLVALVLIAWLEGELKSQDLGDRIPHSLRGISSALKSVCKFLPHPTCGAGLLVLLGSLYHSSSKE